MKANASVTLMVHGKEMTFSNQELIAILEKHFPNEVTEQVATPNATAQEVAAREAEFTEQIAKKIKRVSRTFARDPRVTRRSVLLADTVKRSRLYEIGYCQRDHEMRADYFEYVYDNSFARPRRKKKY